MAYNLDSPNGLLEPVDLANPQSWFGRELVQVEQPAVRHVLRQVAAELQVFVKWPARPLLLWRGCDRIVPPGARQKYHKYPDLIRRFGASSGVKLDTRPNGPAIAAFLLAGGSRPPRFGSSNAWSIHHLYSGKFPYVGREHTTHAAKHGDHFTQSAGLIAVHPIADALCDEYPFFAWLLRAEAFFRFGYDPDEVFSESQGPLGFASGKDIEIIVSSE